MTATIITAILAGLPGLITAIGGLFLHNKNAAKIAHLHAKIATVVPDTTVRYPAGGTTL